MVLTHVKRRGKSAALFTGLRSARGDWVQLLDGDGQNDPADARRIWDTIAAKDENPALGISLRPAHQPQRQRLQMAAVARRQRHHGASACAMTPPTRAAVSS